MIADRIKSKVIINKAGCWIWQGAVVNKKVKFLVPAIKFKGKVVNARRVSYESFIGEIYDDDMIVSRTCEEQLCVNPDHLKLISKKDSLIKAKKIQVYGYHNTTKQNFLCGHPYTEENFHRQNIRLLPRCRTCKNRRSRDSKRALRKKLKLERLKNYEK